MKGAIKLKKAVDVSRPSRTNCGVGAVKPWKKIFGWTNREATQEGTIGASYSSAFLGRSMPKERRVCPLIEPKIQEEQCEFCSVSGNTEPGRYPLEDIRVSVGVCTASLHVFFGLGEGI